MSKFLYCFILVILLAGAYTLYSDQLFIGIAVLTLFLIGSIGVQLILRNWNRVNIFAVFFIIYCTLLLVSQYMYIQNASEYFVHNDAADSFYSNVILTYGPTKWSNLIKDTIFSRLFTDYPIFAFWINLWKLLGLDMGVTFENLRLFLRLQNLIFAPAILTIMAQYLSEIGLSKIKIFKHCCIFGIFSYLYLTSTVFTRDLHVAFFYTLAGYYCLSPFKHRFRYVKLIVIALISFGLRPENGMFATIFPIYYYFRNTIPDTKLLMGGLFVIILVTFSGFFDSFISTLDNYTARTEALNQGGLYAIFNSLPFPLGTLFNIVYSFIMPFPLTMFIADIHIGYLGLPTLAIPFINVIILSTIFQYIKRNKQRYNIIYFFIIIIMYVGLCCSIEPNVRRTFAIIPTMYMLFATVKPYIPTSKYRQIVNYTALFLISINIPAIIYLIMKGKLL